MKLLLSRLQTALLILLVLLSLWQFTVLMNHSQEVFRVVKQENGGETKVSAYNTSHLIAPPRMYAHLPNGDTALLRSSSAHYQTIWNTVLEGSLSKLFSLRPELLQEIEPENSLEEEIGIFLMLPTPMALDQFCAALNIEFASYEHQVLPVINRIYISGERNNFLLLEEGLTQKLYKLPVPSKADVIYNLLEITQNGVYYGLMPVDLSLYGFAAVNTIYAYQQSPYVAARDAGKPQTMQLDALAGRFFDDTGMVRTFTDVNDSLVYYDGIKTLRLLENLTRFPILELKSSIEEVNMDSRPLSALVKELTSMQLWPLTSQYLLDGLDCGEEDSAYYTLFNNGRPIFIKEGPTTVGNTLKISSKEQSVTSLWLVEPVIGAAQKQYAAFSAEYILWSFWNQVDWILPGQNIESLPLRDVYEGYLFSEDQKTIELVWIIEFYNGAKVFYNMVNAEYLGRLAPVQER